MSHSDSDLAFRDWVALNLLDAAMALRMSESGASDPLTDEHARIIREVLAERIAAWRPGADCRADVDNAVKALVEAVLKEADA